MGIRINKTLGWIITNNSLDIEKLENFSLMDLQKENLNCQELQLDLSFPEIDLSQKLSNFVEKVADENIYVFKPPVIGEKWNRYDDIIDYLENNSGETKINYIHRDIFPYCQSFVVSASLNKLTKIESTQCQIFTNMNRFNEEKKQSLLKLGIDETKPLNEQIHMTAPKVIELIFKKCSDLDYRILKPAIITYWG